MEESIRTRTGRVRAVAETAVMMAAVAALTSFVRVPVVVTRGYMNLGDVAVVCFALLLGPKRGAVVGGLGSALSDLLGFPQYVPATLVAKGLEGFLAGWAGALAGGDDSRRARAIRLAGAACGGLVMMATYFAYQAFVLVGWEAALVEVPVNGMQMAAGTVGGVILFQILRFRYGVSPRGREG